MPKTDAERVAQTVVVRPKPAIYAARQLATWGAWEGRQYPPGSWVVSSQGGKVIAILDEITFARMFAIDASLEFDLAE